MTATKRMHLYEGMYILNAHLSEDARKKALARITSSIEEKGGSIEKIHDQGAKKLAYDIKGNRQGHYFVIYFKSPANAIQEMWKEYHLNEDLIRFMTLQTEEVLEKIEFKPFYQERN